MRLRFFLIAIMFVSCAFAQSLERVLPERVGLSSARLAYADSAILKSINAGDIPGAVLAVVKDGKMAYIKAYGYRSIMPRREKMTTNTIFDMASCSKAMSTAICAMVLVERGQLRLSDAVENFIPGFKNWTSADGKTHTTIRIRHLMTHTSGLPPYVSVAEVQKLYGSNNPDSLMSYIASWRRDFEPGTDFQYSCLNYITLQNIIERVSGLSLREFARRNVFSVLGMNHTDYIPCLEDEKGVWKATSLPVWAKDSSDSWLDIVAPTEKQKNGQVLRGEVHDPLARVMNSGVSGNAGVFSNADDIALLCAALINGGELNGRRILGNATVKLMTTVPQGLEAFGRTPGWDNCSDYSSNLGDLLSKSSYGHTGFTGTMIDVDPENRLAIILLTNSVHPAGHTNVIRLRALVANAVGGAMVDDEHTEHYLDRMEAFEKETISAKDIVMLGNSLTENGGNWAERLGKKNVVNRGIIGDDVPGIWERLHQILPYHPAKIVLMEGINDVSHQLSNDEIVQSIANTIDRIRRESPKTQLILQSVLPINEDFKRYKRLEGKTDSIPAINSALETIAKNKGIDFVNLYPLFIETGSNKLREELSTDGLHLNEKGYDIWVAELKKHL